LVVVIYETKKRLGDLEEDKPRRVYPNSLPNLLPIVRPNVRPKLLPN